MIFGHQNAVTAPIVTPGMPINTVRITIEIIDAVSLFEGILDRLFISGQVFVMAEFSILIDVHGFRARSKRFLKGVPSLCKKIALRQRRCHNDCQHRHHFME
jgi:hypothetical protein